MARFSVTAIAERDVRRILTGLAKRAGYSVASRYTEEFKAAYRAIAQSPGSGPPRQALGPNTRIKTVYPYVIIYDHEVDTVIVLRVLHGRRNITRALIRRSKGG